MIVAGLRRVMEAAVRRNQYDIHRHRSTSVNARACYRLNRRNFLPIYVVFSNSLPVEWRQFLTARRCAESGMLWQYAVCLSVYPSVCPLHSRTVFNSFQLECGPMPNVMAAQPNIGGAL